MSTSINDHSTGHQEWALPGRCFATCWPLYCPHHSISDSKSPQNRTKYSQKARLHINWCDDNPNIWVQQIRNSCHNILGPYRKTMTALLQQSVIAKTSNMFLNQQFSNHKIAQQTHTCTWHIKTHSSEKSSDTLHHMQPSSTFQKATHSDYCMCSHWLIAVANCPLYRTSQNTLPFTEGLLSIQ